MGIGVVVSGCDGDVDACCRELWWGICVNMGIGCGRVGGRTYCGDTVVEDCAGAASEGHGDDGGAARGLDLLDDPVEPRHTIDFTFRTMWIGGR